MVKVRKATGREPGRFKPHDLQPRIVSRMGIYTFAAGSTTTSAFNIADAGGTATGAGLQTGATSGYDDRNILIHWIKVINDGTGYVNLDQTKQLHFWCKNDTTVPANEVFTITVPPANKDTDGGLDVTIDLPIPLLIEGGAIIRPSSSGSNHQMVVTICYTVLNSKSVGSSSIRYKFLSAVTVDELSKTAYIPGTTDTYNEDIQIWGVSMINLYNTFGGAHLAETHVINADGVTIAEVAIHKEDSKSIPIPWLDNTHKCDEYSDPSATPYHATQEICEAATNHAGGGDQDDHWGWNLLISDWERVTAYPGARNKGSDTYTTFFRFPIYCKGNTTAPNFEMGVDTADRTRATWFYRPVKAVGLDHGWV